MDLVDAKEKRILRALSILGEAPISAIARETLINRTALYHTVKGLVSKGLVTSTTKGGTTYVQSISLSDYDKWMKRRAEELSANMNSLRKSLQVRVEGTSLRPDMRYFDGKEGIKNLYGDTWRDNKEKIIYAITDYEQAYKTMKDFFEDEYFPDRLSHNIKVKNLLPKSSYGIRDMKKAKEMLRDMRFIDIFKNFGIEINIYGPKVSIVAFDKHNPSGVIIKNEIVASAFKRLFEYIWSSAESSRNSTN